MNKLHLSPIYNQHKTNRYCFIAFFIPFQSGTAIAIPGGKEVREMKKAISIGLAVVLVATLVTAAIAFGPGHGRGMGYGIVGSGFTTEQAQKFAQFQQETLPLRQKMQQLRTDLLMLRTQTSPDWEAITAKQKEMVDLRVEIQKKAAEAGITGFGPGFGLGYCRGGIGMYNSVD